MESYWQSNKSVLDRNRHMLEKEILVDVTFLVGREEEEIKAHKYMLISASEVFHRMLYGPMATPGNPIQIPDIEADVFRQMLDFVYWESTEFTLLSCFCVVYAARKYMLDNLELKIVDFLLREELTVENVCVILDQSLASDLNPVTQRCMSFISKYADKVFKNQGILTVSNKTLLRIASMEAMHASERQLYDVCVKWASKKVPQRKRFGDGGQLREVLGEILHRIRFPTMTLEEFADLASEPNALSPQEQSAIFVYIASKKPTKDLNFDCRVRTLFDEFTISRFNYSESDWEVKNGLDAVNFHTDRNISLIGVGLYASRSYFGNVTVEVWNGLTQLLCNSNKTIVSDGTPTTPKRIPFDEPLRILSSQQYTIVVRYDDPPRYHGVQRSFFDENLLLGVARLEERSSGVSFVFSKPRFGENAIKDFRLNSPGFKHDPNSFGATTGVLGQIPQLIFHL